LFVFPFYSGTTEIIFSYIIGNQEDDCQWQESRNTGVKSY